MNQAKFKKKLAELQKQDPELFKELIGQFNQNGARAFEESLPPARKGNASVKRTKYVRLRVWAMVEMLRRRDGIDVKQACVRLDNFGMDTFHQYKTPDHMWRVSEEQKPETFAYEMPDWQGLRGLYYEFEKSADDDDMGLAECFINFFEDDDEWQAKYLPPRVKTQR